jgi:hypothetical protein
MVYKWETNKMTNESDNFNEKMPSISLYRISDEVKNELVRALNFWNVASGSKNPLLTELIIRELKVPYTTTDMINASTSDNTTPNIRLHNGVVAFKQQLQKYLDTDNKEINDVASNLISTFKLCIEDVL